MNGYSSTLVGFSLKKKRNIITFIMYIYTFIIIVLYDMFHNPTRIIRIKYNTLLIVYKNASILLQNSCGFDFL